MKKLVVVLTMSMVVVAFFTADTTASPVLDWVFSPDSTQTPGTPESVYWVNGNVEIGTPINEAAQQAVGIYGVGAALPMAYNDAGFYISFDWLFNTWDSYNAPGTAGTQPNGLPVMGTGWWDSFSATITKGDYYWNLPLMDPITTDPGIETIFVLEAGTSFGDGFLETYSGPWTTIKYVPPTIGDQYYLNLVIDTGTFPDHNGNYPSWGEFSEVTVQAIPAPGAILLGSIGVGFVSWLRRRRTL